MAAKDQCKFIEPPDFLKRKVVKGKGLGWKTIEARAQAATEGMKLDFLDYLSREATLIDDAMRQARAGGQSERTAALLTVFKISHDLRGQGATLDYPLVTAICQSLCNFIAGNEGANLKVIEIHVEAMKAVAAGQIKGDGGAVGKELLSGIKKLTAKMQGAQPA